MKRLFFICGLLFSMITFANAQDGQGGGRGPGGNPEDRAKRNLAMVAEKLKLTDDQKTKVTAIYLEQNVKMRKLRDSIGDDKDGMRAVMTKHNDQTDAKIEALLTDDQKKLFIAYKEERKEMMKKRMEGGGRPGGTK